MKFRYKFFIFLILVIVAIFCYKRYKPQIVVFLNDKGISVPGVTDDSQLFPTSETVVDENGQVRILVSVPSAYTSSMTDEQIDEMVNGSDGRLTATRQSDGSLSLSLTDEYRDEILDQMSVYYDDTVLAQLIGGNVLSISHNSDYSAFSVTYTSDMSETDILTLAGKLFAIGKFYGSFAGNENESIRVDMVNNETGFITNSYLSDDMGQGIASDAVNWATDTFDNVVDNVVDTMENVA